MTADRDDDTPNDSPRVPTRERVRRAQSQTERDELGIRARIERNANVPREIESVDEITGKYAGEDLDVERSKRPADERIAHLERKHDKLVEAVNQVGNSVAEMRGEMKVIPELVSVLKDVAKRRDERETITLTTKLDVDKQTALDPIKAREARRGWVTAIIAIISTIAAGTLAIVQARGC